MLRNVGNDAMMHLKDKKKKEKKGKKGKNSVKMSRYDGKIKNGKGTL